MFLRRIALILVARHLQSLNETQTGVTGRDDFVDVTQLGGRHGVGKFFSVLLYLLGTLFWCCLAIKDVASTLCSHHSDFRCGVGEVHVCPDALGVHHDVSTAVCLAGDEGNLWYGGFGKGIDYLGSVTDDAVVLLLHSRQETWHILNSR